MTSSTYRRTKLFDSQRFRCDLMEVLGEFRQQGLSADRTIAELRSAPADEITRIS
jgi:hypothetical protein